MADPDESSEPPPSAPSSPLGRLGRTLRHAYDEAATEPLPQAFEDLLRQLR